MSSGEEARIAKRVEEDEEVKNLSRRDALKTIGALPVVGTLSWSDLLAKHARAPKLDEAAPKPGLKFLSAHEFRTLSVVADYIIPKDGKTGSATDAKAPEFIDFMLADPDASANTRTAMRGALAWLDHECHDRYGTSFVDSSDTQRRAVLDDVAFPKKARPEMQHGVVAFSRLRDSVASAFYSSQMGWQDLQYQGNVFNPNWNGCPEPALKKLGVSYEEYNASLAGQRKK